jgi:uncharacterized protein
MPRTPGALPEVDLDQGLGLERPPNATEGVDVRVAVTGSHGTIGSALIDALEARGDQPVRMVRPSATAPWARDLESADAVVHLAGQGIGDHRWSEAQRAEILRSRVEGTGTLAAALAEMAPCPGVFVSASAVGYYGSRPGEPLSEASAPGRGFLAEVCQAWEGATRPAIEAGVRTVHLRSGVVLSAGGGALARQLPIFRLGLGGPLGSGRQYVSWISLWDEVAAILHCLDNDGVVGAVNAVAPRPVTARQFAKALGRALHRPAVLRVPRIALQIALGRDLVDELLLSDQRVAPQALLASGYQFVHPELEPCLASLVGAAGG